MKFRNQALIMIKRHLKILIIVATGLLLLILGYALYLFYFVSKAVQLGFLGAVIGIPTSILITALSSNYEFNRERKRQEIQGVGTSLYKIIISLREIKHDSLSLSKLYAASIPKELLRNQNIVSISSLVDSPNVDTITLYFDQLREQIYSIPPLQSKLKNRLEYAQNEVNSLADQIDHLKTLKSVEITDEYIGQVNNSCLTVYVQSRDLLKTFRRISTYLYR